MIRTELVYAKVIFREWYVINGENLNYFFFLKIAKTRFQKRTGNKLYCVFMDYGKAFDKRTIGPVAHLRDHHIVRSWDLN